MHVAPPELTVRSLTGPDELGLFCRLSYVLDHELADAAGRRRPDWMWVALHGERVVGRVSWWTSRDGGAPLALDFFDLDDTLPAQERHEIGVRLVETATAAVVPAGAERPEYGRFIPPDWREDPIIAYIGVLPAHRGKGYIDDVLAEGTRVLAATGVDRIRAATDLGNVPMAKSFESLGYVNFERAFNMVWD
ncbi:GNAT family N-acetyltransferase [Streptomyces finlayi]|uniref:GNAT family N-acetyltransferase n=1 Tax=Streptomyces finlayi TaxID=67296 RepID=A0A7G7BFG1_9ACTN|nr:GNAT family N-acetyltransferase [Streptomyces finlayi]QNE74076.1 GNAT family N-acetyltransferase [Streptomyces finlayi]